MVSKIKEKFKTQLPMPRWKIDSLLDLDKNKFDLDVFLIIG